METRTPSAAMKMCMQEGAIPPMTTRCRLKLVKVQHWWIIGTSAGSRVCVVSLGLVQHVNKRLLVVIPVLKVETNLLNRNSCAFRDVKFCTSHPGGKEATPSAQLFSGSDAAALSHEDGWRSARGSVSWMWPSLPCHTSRFPATVGGT